MDIGFGGFRQPEVDLEGTMGNVVAAPAEVANLGTVGGGDGNPRAQPEVIRGGPFEPDREVVVVVRRLVPVQHDIGRGVVRDQDIDVAVAVEIEARDPASLGVVGETDLAGDLPKHHVGPGVVEEPEGATPVVLAIDQVPAVDVQYVQIAVILEVRSAGSPPPSAILHARRKGDVHEFTVVVSIEEVAEVVAVQLGRGRRSK